MHQRFKKYFSGNPELKATHLAWIGLIRLSYLAGRFYGPKSRISRKVYSESLMNALSPCEVHVESNCNSF